MIDDQLKHSREEMMHLSDVVTEIEDPVVLDEYMERLDVKSAECSNLYDQWLEVMGQIIGGWGYEVVGGNVLEI